MRFVNAIDGFVLKHITKFSHWFQRLTGKTCYFLAKTMFLMVVSVFIISACNYWIRVLYFKSLFLDVVVAPICIWFWKDHIYMMDKSDEHLFGGNRTKLLNVWMIMPLARTIGLIISPLSFFGLRNAYFAEKGFWLFNINYELVVIYMTLGAYFASVDPLSPGVSKVREWIESFNAGFRKLQPLRPPVK